MRTLNDYFITSAIPDVSTASSTFVCVPDGGKIIKIITHNKAVTTGTAAISFEIGGVAVTGGAISHTASGSAGRVATAAPTALKELKKMVLLNVSLMVVQQILLKWKLLS